MQAWMEAEKSMRRPSCFRIRSQESNQRGKLEYFVPLQRLRVSIFFGGVGDDIRRSTLQAGGTLQRPLVSSKLPKE